MYFGCVFVALGSQHEMLLRHIVMCGLSGSAIQFHIISKAPQFLNKMCALNFSTTFVSNIAHSKKKWARYDQKCLLGST